MTTNTTKPIDKPNGWEQDFDKRFSFYAEYDAGVLDDNGEGFGGGEASKRIKDFISKTRDNLLREIMEEMPKEKDPMNEPNEMWMANADGFNSAIYQVNTLLESKLSTVKK